MILTELYKLYDRLEDDTEFEEALPRLGMSKQKMSFLVILTPDGRLFDIQDAKVQKVLPPKTKNGKEKIVSVTRDLIVPGGAHPSGPAPTPRLLWDSTAYIFGCYPGKAKKDEKDKIKARDALFPSFRERHRQFRDANGLCDSGLDAVVAFLDSWDPANIPDDIREKINQYGDNFGTFAIQGETGYVFESPAVKEACLREELNTDSSAPRGTCLITGKNDMRLARIVETRLNLEAIQVAQQ